MFKVQYQNFPIHALDLLYVHFFVYSFVECTIEGTIVEGIQLLLVFLEHLLTLALVFASTFENLVLWLASVHTLLGMVKFNVRSFCFVVCDDKTKLLATNIFMVIRFRDVLSKIYITEQFTFAAIIIVNFIIIEKKRFI